MNKTEMKIATAMLVLLSTPAWASPLSATARTVIPFDVHQVISVDYGTVKKSDAAMTLKTQVLPDNLKEFESALKSVGVNPDGDLESLTFASFDKDKKELDMLGVASGSFSSKVVLEKMRLQQAKPVKFHDSDLYPIYKTITITFLDDNTLLLGSDSALRVALNVRHGDASNVGSNRKMMGMIKTVQKAPVWSVLDQQGSQNMLLSALGDPRKLPDFENIRQGVLGSRYMMNFDRGCSFYMDVLTSDIDTSALLSSVLKAGLLYKKISANAAQKIALENLKVTSEHVTPPSNRSHLKMHFKVDQEQFQKLLRSECFVAIASERKELSGVTSGSD